MAQDDPSGLDLAQAIHVLRQAADNRPWMVYPNQGPVGPAIAATPRAPLPDLNWLGVLANMFAPSEPHAAAASAPQPAAPASSSEPYVARFQGPFAVPPAPGMPTDVIRRMTGGGPFKQDIENFQEALSNLASSRGERSLEAPRPWYQLSGTDMLAALARKMGADEAGERLLRGLTNVFTGSVPTKINTADDLLGAVAPAAIPESSLGQTVEGLTGVFAPKTPVVRGATAAEMRALQEANLSEQQLNKLADLKQQYPAFGRAADFMTPTEISKTIASTPNVETVNRLLETIPRAQQMSALAKAGSPKQGWYRASSQALMDVFGVEDAPRFAALLAGMSPQTSVEMNLLNTLNTWRNWTAAGRPTEAAAIKRIMGQSVAGRQGEASVLDAWVNNSISALSSPDPLKTVLSGPKVDSFYRNLMDDVYRVTNDAHISNAMGVSQGLFSGSASPQQLARGDPGLSPGYIATSARIRQGAQQAGMLPSEGQETIWSVAMPLMELQAKLGLPAREILQRGLLTPDVIRGTPDFSTLLKQGEYGRILEAAGYGDKLDALKSFGWPSGVPQLTAAEQREVEKVAERLENLRSSRLRESRSTSIAVPGQRPENAFWFEHAEMVPGRKSGLMSGMIDQPFNVRQNYSSRIAGAFQDLNERDILHQSLGLPTLATRPATGAWQPEGSIEGVLGEGKGPLVAVSHPRETNPAYAIGGESQVVPKPKKAKSEFEGLDLPQSVKDRLDTAAYWRGIFTGQDAVSWSSAIPNPGDLPHVPPGVSMHIPAEGKAPRENLRYLDALANGRVFFGDTGAGVNVMNFGDALPQETRELAAGLLGGEKGTHIPADIVAGYKPIEWGEPSGTVTTKALDRMQLHSAAEQRAFDKHVRGVAGDLFDQYSKKAAQGWSFPEHIRNFLDSVRSGGLNGLRTALQNGVVLPASLVTALGLSYTSSRASAPSGKQQAAQE